MHPLIETTVSILDQDHPNWWQVVDLETLNMSDTACCVVGQNTNFHDFVAEHIYHGPHYAEWRRTGMGISALSTGLARWDEMKQIWVEEIVARRNAATEMIQIGEEERELEAPAPVDVPSESPEEAPSEVEAPVEEPVLV